MSKRYKVQVVVIALLVTLSSGLVLTAYHYNSFQTMFAMNAVFGFSALAYTISLIEILTQTTYPINESFVMTIFSGIVFVGCFVAIVLDELERVVYNNSGGFWMLAFQTGFAFIGLRLTITLSNSNKRFDAETMLREDAQVPREDSSLLHQSWHFVTLNIARMTKYRESGSSFTFEKNSKVRICIQTESTRKHSLSGKFFLQIKVPQPASPKHC